tara:strand:- start:30020 stop:30184 length:165 start_codon:yes stop_codon:yes gene_type:complete
MKKRIFDVFFIVISIMILMIISYYDILEIYMTYALIPILIAYYLGQFSERKFNK